MKVPDNGEAAPVARPQIGQEWLMMAAAQMAALGKFRDKQDPNPAFNLIEPRHERPYPDTTPEYEDRVNGSKGLKRIT